MAIRIGLTDAHRGHPWRLPTACSPMRYNVMKPFICAGLVSFKKENLIAY